MRGMSQDGISRFFCYTLSFIYIDEDVVMQFVHNIYERKIGKGKIDEDMWGEYVRIYRDAVSKGYGMSHNTSFDRSSRMADQIEHNIEVFSAFKTHNQQELMAQKMLKDGKRVGFDEFKAAVEPIARHHNGAWLQTEYATASLRAAQAADWQEFEQNADIFPNLKWMPTTSARPDEAVHGTYSGLTGPQVILPIRDPFWDNHRPGDRWNCKCGLEPTDEPSLHQTNKRAAARAEQGKPTGQRGLQANPGKKGEVFDTKHPYFPKSCKQCPFFSVSTGVKNASTTPHCQSCRYIDKVYGESRYRKDKEFGDRLLISETADAKELEVNTNTARIMLEHIPEIKITIRPHIISNTGIKNPEYTINGEIADAKRILSENGVNSGFVKALKQNCSIVVLDWTLNERVLHYNVLVKKIQQRFRDFESKRITHCYVVTKKGVVVFNHDEVKEENTHKGNREYLVNKLKKLDS